MNHGACVCACSDYPLWLLTHVIACYRYVCSHMCVYMCVVCVSFFLMGVQGQQVDFSIASPANF